MMGTCYLQALAVSGPSTDLVELLDAYVSKDITGQPSNFDYAKLASIAGSQVAVSGNDSYEWANWAFLDPLTFEVDSASNEQLVIRLSIKLGPTWPALMPLAHRFPALQFRLLSIDDGYMQAYMASCVAGNFTERFEEVTDDLIAEAEGEAPDIECDWYEPPPSVPRPWPQTHIRYWFAERRLQRALLDYPVYVAPFPGIPAKLARDEAEANLQHFKVTCDERLEQLGKFLKRFGVKLESTDRGIRELDRWVKRYAGFLALHEQQVLDTHTPAWRGAWAANNVMFDLGTFVGQVVIERNPGFHWNLYEVPPTRRKSDPSHQRIFIQRIDPGSPRGTWPFHRVSSICQRRREQSLMWKKPSMIFEPREAVDRPIAYFLAQEAQRVSQLQKEAAR